MDQRNLSARDSFWTRWHGNHWIVDCISTPEEKAVLFYDCHDAPVLLVQGVGMGDFLIDLVKLSKDDDASIIDAVHEDRRFNIWRTNPNGLLQNEALSSPDPAVRTFAEGLDPRFILFDLREAPSGMGFSWGRYKGDPNLRRFGEARIFALAPPEKKPTLFRRLFGQR